MLPYIYQLLTVCSLAVLCHGLTFELPDKEELCFYEEFDGAEQRVVRYKVIRGGKLDVDLKVATASGKLVYNKNKQNKDKFQFESGFGVYSFCFSNKFSTFTHKLVDFELSSTKPSSLTKKVGDKRARVPSRREAQLEEVFQNAVDIQNEQKLYRLREAAGRYIAEDLNVRVMWQSMGESCIIILSGIVQIFVLRRFFSDTDSKRLQSLPTAPRQALPVNKC